MKQRLTIYILVIAVVASALCGCNKKDEEDPEIQEITYSNVTVQAFSLEKNDSVLAHLDSVFFAIDLNTATIYNADSLPVGTDVSKLVLKITLPSVNSAIITETPAPGKDAKEIDYVKSPKDSVSFTYGDAKLKIVSYDKKVTRDYTIKVNVHNMVPDSLYWNRAAVTSLPGNVEGSLLAQKTVLLGKTIYCFVENGDGVTLSTTTAPDVYQWASQQVTLPASARVETITAAGGSLYLLDADGNLYTSADGTAWEATSENFHWLYGDYNGSLLASRNDGGAWTVVSYPSLKSVAVDGDKFPVEGTSSMVTFETKWADNPTSIFIGGRTATGRFVDTCWGFDGNEWATISMVSLPEGMTGMTLVPYFCYATDKASWVSTRSSVLLAWGGLKSSGAVNRDLYVSYDAGIRWRKATDLLQLPDYMPALYNAQAIVYPSTLTARSGNGWVEMPSRRIPAWLMLEVPVAGSRATAPINEWECPYIYQFGGIDAQGEVQNTIWRGVINRLTFKPLQ